MRLPSAFAACVSVVAPPLAIALGAAPLPAQTTGPYTSPLGAGFNLLAGTSGDLNGDGRPDFVAVGFQPAQISRLFALPSGGYSAPALSNLVAPSGAPQGAHAAIVDVNADGKKDVVAIGWSTTGGLPFLDVFLGTASGALAPPTATLLSSSTSWTAERVAVGDVNGDGKPDLAIAISGSGSPGVLLALGNGVGFGAATPVATGGGANDVVLADVNLNGTLDLVVAQSSGAVAVLLGNGGGGFGAPASKSMSGIAQAVAVGDVNQDGKPDVAVADDHGLFAPGTVELYAGNGAGGLASSVQSLSGGNVPAAIALSDVDGDGDLDAVVGNFGSANLAVLKGAGPLGLAAATTTPLDGAPRDVVVADLNADARVDFATFNASQHLQVFLAVRPAAFAPANTTAIANVGPDATALGDMNGDGVPDAVVLDATANAMGVFAGTASGAFVQIGAWHAFHVTGMPFVVADLNADGNLDVVFGSSVAPRLAITFGDGAGGLGAPAAVDAAISSPPFALAAGEMTGDGAPDLCGVQLADPHIDVWAATSPGVFAAPVAHASPGGEAFTTIALGDLNGDGKADAVATSQNVFVMLSSPTGFGAVVQAGAAVNAQSPAVGDVTGDGFLDVVVAAGNLFGGLPTSVQIFPGFGTGLATPIGIPTSQDSWPLTLGDVNGDGHSDVVVSPFLGAATSYVLDGFGGVATFAVPVPANARVRLADWNADGRLDVVGATTSSLVTNANASIVGASTPYGPGTPGCLGALGLAVSSSAHVGNASFAFIGSGAPPSSSGFVMVADVASAGIDLFGVQLLVDPFASGLFVTLGAQSDSAGAIVSKAPLPSAPGIAGATLHAQALWVEKPKDGWSCTASSLGLVSSKGMTFTIAP